MATERTLVLVVDDHELLRQLTARLLDGHGFEVIALGDAEQAMAVVRARGDELGVLISDVSMPGISGPELGTMARAEQPGLPLLFVTGFAAGSVVQQLPEGSQLLEKPFGRNDLLAQVRTALAGDTRP